MPDPVTPDREVESQDQDNILRDLDLNLPADRQAKKQTITQEKVTMPKKSKTSIKILLMLSLVAIAAGVGTGFGAFKLRASKPQISTDASLKQVADNDVKVGDVFGIKDDQTFKDSAQGYLDEGDPDMEGSHQLLRPGGDSQTVYLTSSVTDLDKFVGMQVKVKGETFKGQKAAWLMDVGQVEILELEASPPSED